MSARSCSTRTDSALISSLEAPPSGVGLGTTTSVDELEVLWPDGTRETFPCEGVDREVVLRRGEGQTL